METKMSSQKRFELQEVEWQAERVKLLYDFINSTIAAKRTGWTRDELTQTFNTVLKNLETTKPEYFSE